MRFRLVFALVAVPLAMGALAACDDSPTRGSNGSDVGSAGSTGPTGSTASDPGAGYGLEGLTSEVVKETITTSFAKEGTLDPGNPCTPQVDFRAVRIAPAVSTHQVEWGKDAQPVIVVQPEYTARCDYPDPHGSVGFINDADYVREVPNSNQKNFYFWRDSFGDWKFVVGS